MSVPPEITAPSPEDLKRLWDHCREFFIEQRITCPETIVQSDRVIVNAYSFIDGIGEIIGYPQREEDE